MEEMTITTGFGMVEWRDTLNGKVTGTASHNILRILLSARMSAGTNRTQVDGT